MGISQVLWGSVGSGEGIREWKQLCRGAQGWAWFGGSSCFLNQRWGSPSGQWQVHPTLESSGPQGPAAPEPWVWTPRGQVGRAGRLLPPQDVRGPGCCQGGRGWRGRPAWEEDTLGQLVDSGRPHQDCASVRGLLGHEEVQLVGLSEQAWGGSRGGGGSSFADAQTSPAFFLLVTGKGALTGVSRGTTFVPRAYQGWSLGLLGEAHAVPVQPCPPGPGGIGQEALVWPAPAHKLPSPCPEGALTLHVGFSF